MSLIKCPECGKEISSECLSCPHCGYLNNKNKSIIENEQRNLEITKITYELSTYKTNHILHLILSICTGGFWVIVWMIITERNNCNKAQCENTLSELTEVECPICHNTLKKCICSKEKSGLKNHFLSNLPIYIKDPFVTLVIIIIIFTLFIISLIKIVNHSSNTQTNKSLTQDSFNINSTSVPQPTPTINTSKESNWYHVGKEKDKISDKVTDSIATYATQSKTGSRYDKPIMAILCNKNDDKIHIALGGFFAGSSASGIAKLRFNKEHPLETYYSGSRDGQTVFLGDDEDENIAIEKLKPKEILFLIKTKNSLVIRLEDTFQGSMDFTFNLKGASRAINQLCK